MQCNAISEWAGISFCLLTMRSPWGVRVRHSSFLEAVLLSHNFWVLQQFSRSWCSSLPFQNQALQHKTNAAPGIWVQISHLQVQHWCSTWGQCFLVCWFKLILKLHPGVWLWISLAACSLPLPFAGPYSMQIPRSPALDSCGLPPSPNSSPCPRHWLNGPGGFMATSIVHLTLLG